MNHKAPARTIPWKSIEDLRDDEIPRNGLLGALDALRGEWSKRMANLTEDERREVRARSQRKLSVETGVLERLYDVEWGLTLTLVAEGFGREVVERAGGKMDDRTLATLRAQMDSILMVMDFVRDERPLSTSFIKEIHQAITRTQNTYVTTDSLGRVCEIALPRGEWKKHANHVLRADGFLLEYAPPEHVAAEMDRLISLWEKMHDNGFHPIVEAAWLHHRFVQIHPFADGNGRVARALTLLVLEKCQFPPLVIDRWHRNDYFDALEKANEGSLLSLVRLFARLESAALVSELEKPVRPAGRGFSDEIAHTLADQIVALKRREADDLRRQLNARSLAVSGRIETWFDSKKNELSELFKSKGIQSKVQADHRRNPDARAYWYHRQIVDSAHKAGHYADFSGSVSWSRVRIEVENLFVDFVASLHGAGREPGVCAVTTFGELGVPSGEIGQGAMSKTTFDTTNDAFSFLYSESSEAIEKRSTDLDELLDEGLAVALTKLMQDIFG
jgi:hypothetical protein